MLLSLANKADKALGMMPLSPKLSVPPLIVKVLPEPVCPYAKIVPLIPHRAASTMG